MTDLRQQTEHLILTQALLAPGQRLLVAVSGGLDSVVLLHLLAQLAPRHGWHLHVAHLNHRLRGTASTADQRHVQQLAAQLRLPCTVGQANAADAGDIRALARAKKLSVEMAARTIRHRFLARTARRHKITTIALAHHADDQLEHFLLRLLRGTSPQGLVGMPLTGPSPFRLPPSKETRSSDAGSKRIAGVQLIRPLLPLTKAELRAYARAHHLTWREDATNLSSDIPRNRIRHRLIPYLQKNHQPALAHVIARFTETLRAETEYVGAIAQAWLDQLAGEVGRSVPAEPLRSENRSPGLKGRLLVAGFDALPVAIQRRVIHDQLTRPEFGVPRAALDFDLIEALRTQPAGTPVSLPDSPRKPDAAARAPRSAIRVSLRRDVRGKLHLTKTSPARRSEPARPRTLKLNSAAGHTLYHGLTLTWKITSGSTPKRPSALKSPSARRDPHSTFESFDADTIGSAITLRHWQPGDRFHPIGMPAPLKLQDWFTNQKIPREKRHQLLLALDASGRIFWVEGCRISDLHKITPATRRILRWGCTETKPRASRGGQ